MAKTKGKNKAATVPNKHIHSRVNYLYQAAIYLEAASGQSKTSKGSGNSRHLVDQLHGVALKSQIRLASSIKHSVCKRCQSFLKEGTTLSTYVENKSRGSSKPWADVLVRECQVCNAVRRFPIGAERQQRREKRSPDDKDLVEKPEVHAGESEA